MQAPINVELPNNVILKLDELVSGDVELSFTEGNNSFLASQDGQSWSKKLKKYVRVGHSGGQEAARFVIPKNRRCLVAGWLVGDSCCEADV